MIDARTPTARWRRRESATATVTFTFDFATVSVPRSPLRMISLEEHLELDAVGVLERSVPRRSHGRRSASV